MFLGIQWLMKHSMLSTHLYLIDCSPGTYMFEYMSDDNDEHNDGDGGEM